jgi:hypothetical protein
MKDYYLEIVLYLYLISYAEFLKVFQINNIIALNEVSFVFPESTYFYVMNRFKENYKFTCDLQYTYAFYCENYNERGRLRILGIERMIVNLSATESVNYPWCRLDSCGSG